MSDPTKYEQCCNFFNNEDTDVLIYWGAIERDGYERFCKILTPPHRKKLLLVLCTFGGDPNAGYRIARAAIHQYEAKNFRILIPKHCKSAGTLICIGASALVMADQAELGPLDVQLRKQDELFQQSSGLDILRGITYLQNEALQSFKSYLIDINGGGGLSTKLASEISSKLVIGLYEPLFAQVDPIKLGEMNAALEIAKHYGERLNQKSESLNSDALSKLIMAYPTHGFVIDRSEARTLFKKVDKPNDNEQLLCDLLIGKMLPLGAYSEPIVKIFNPQALPKRDSNEFIPTPQPANEATTNICEKQQQSRHDGESSANHEREQSIVGSEQSNEGANEERHE